MHSKRCAVIGNPIEHSLSPQIHHSFASQTQLQLTYEKIKGCDDYFERQVTEFFGSGGTGLNITLPFKQRAFALAIQHTERCSKVLAANTLWMEKDRLVADNTDGIGLVRDLSRYRDLAGSRILILGAGGAARGIIGALLEVKPESIVLANRMVQKARDLQIDFPQIKCAEFAQLTCAFDIVINATAASLHGQLITLPQECWEHKPFCYDLAYLQSYPTVFVTDAESKGCEAVDGLGMLVEQAAEAFFIWHGVKPITEPVIASFRKKTP